VAFLAIWCTCSTYRRKRHTEATPPSRAANALCRNGGFDWVEVVEAERISLVCQRLFGFLLWNRRGKKVEAPPTVSPHLSHSVGKEKFKCRNDF